jgi:hypothetical protein
MIYSRPKIFKPRMNNTAAANEPRTEVERGMGSTANDFVDCSTDGVDGVDGVAPTDDKDVAGGASDATSAANV